MRLADAFTDPEILGCHFAAPSWRPWLAFVRALAGSPLDSADLALYQQHTGRQAPPTVPFSEAALVCGRRSGKTRVMAGLATALAVLGDWERHLGAGELATVLVVASDRRQARGALRYVRGFLNSSPLLAPLVERDDVESIELSNRVSIEVGTCSLRSVRGASLAGVICDEVSFWRDDSSANPDVEVLTALRPGLSSLPGSLLLLASSPYAKRGELYRAWRENWGQDHSRVLVWRGSTLEMNSTIDPTIVERAYEADPASAAAEYGAEFRSDIATFVAREVLDACTVLERFELPPFPGCVYHAFVDPSGGSSDSMTLAIAHAEDDRAVLDLVREVRPPFSPESVVLDFSAALQAYGLWEVTGDRYGGEWPRERFQINGITYLLADRPKSELYRELLPVLNSGKAELLDHRVLLTQLAGLERRTARGGRDSIDHARGAHDDVANAAAGALLMAAGRVDDAVANLIGACAGDFAISRSYVHPFSEFW